MQPMKTPGASESGTWQMKAEARSAGATVVESEKAFTVTVTPAAAIQTFVCDHASPQAAGRALRWTATATGGVPPLEYRFERQDGGTWSVVQPYSAAASYEWTPQAGDAGEHAVRVSVRSVGSTAAWEDQETLAMTIAPPNGAMQRRPDFLTALLAKVRLRLASDERHEPVSLSIGMEPLAGHAVAPLADHGVAPLAQAVEKHALYTPELNLMVEATDGVVEYEYVWFGGQPVAQFETSTGATHWYFDDHLGTPLVTTDATGTIDWQVEREPYGAIHAVRTGAARHQPLALPGQEDGGELSYNIFRWYRAGWGRYRYADPIGLQGGINLYAYALGNPVGVADPLGLEATLVCRRVDFTGESFLRRAIVQRVLRPLHCRVRVTCGCGDGATDPRAPFDRTVGLENMGGGGYQLNSDQSLAPRFSPGGADYSGSPWGQVNVRPPGGSSGCSFERCILREHARRAGQRPQDFPPYRIQGPNSNSYVKNLIETCGGSANYPWNAWGAGPNPAYDGSYGRSGGW